MRKNNKKYLGFTLVEMLIVMAIVIILGAFGTGGFIGFRETMTARENVQTIMQDIQRARNMAMNVEKEKDDPWLYGIVMNFDDIRNGRYYTYKWESEFSTYGNLITTSKFPRYDPNKPIGSSLLDCQTPCSPDVCNHPWAPPGKCDERTTECEQSCMNNITYGDCNCGPVDTNFKNAQLPYNYKTDVYTPGQTSLEEIKGSNFLGLVDVDYQSRVDAPHFSSTSAWIVFEAVTGRVFLYKYNGTLINVDDTGEPVETTQIRPVRIVLTRRFSSKFDVIAIDPISGVPVHRVYDQRNPDCPLDSYTNQCFNLLIPYHNPPYERIYGNYISHTAEDEIKSYRDLY